MTSMDQFPHAGRNASPSGTPAVSAEVPAEAAEPDPLLYPRPGLLAGDRYRLVDRLGRGASAEVWRGWDTRLGRPVAVKIFRDATEGDPAARARRSGEARLLASLSHQHLVAIYDAAGFGSEHEVSWIAMELVDGRTLREVIATGPLPEPTVAAIGRQLADALDYVHRRGAIHRDVKPANVLLANSPADGAHGPEAQAEPFVKLTDFGVARLLDDTHLTLEGFTIGTANYLSPEQVTGNACGPAVDVYALGLVLLEALTGTIAYPGVGAEAALVRLHRPPHMPEWLPAEWRTLLSAMTARVPAARPSLTVVRAELAALAASSATVPETAKRADGADSALSGLDDLFPTDLVPLALAAAAGEGDAVPDRSDGGQGLGGSRVELRRRRRRARRRRATLLLAAVAAVVAGIATPLAFGGSASPTQAAAATAPSQRPNVGSENAARARTSTNPARLVPAADIRDMRGTPPRRHRPHVVAHVTRPTKRTAPHHRHHRARVHHRARRHQPRHKAAGHVSPAPHKPPAPPAPGPYQRPGPPKPPAPKPKPPKAHDPHHPVAKPKPVRKRPAKH